MKLIDVGQKIG